MNATYCHFGKEADGELEQVEPLGARFSTRDYLLALAPFLIALVFWWSHPTISWDMDSLGYLNGDPARTATYHLLVAIFYGPLLLPIQLLLFAAALAWLALYLRAYMAWPSRVALVLIIAANPFVWQLQATLMSEAITTPLLTVIVGSLIGYIATGRSVALFSAAFLCGVAASARPSLAIFVAAPLCAIWVGPPGAKLRLMATTAVLLVWVAPIVAEKLYSRTIYGEDITSYVGRNIFMKAAMLDAPNELWANPSDRVLAGALERDYDPVRRLIQQTPDRDIRYILTTNYEGCAGYGCFDPLIKHMHLREADLERHMLKVGLARSSANPLEYFRLSVTEYQKMFLLHPRKHPDLAPKWNAFLARESPIPFQSILGDAGRPTPTDQQKMILRFNRLAFAAIGILAALMTFGFGFWRPGPRLGAAFVLLFGTQMVLIFTMFLGNGQPRYAMGMWPALIGGEVLGLLGILEVWVAKRSHGIAAAT